MADKTMSVTVVDGGTVQLRLADNGDGTYSFGSDITGVFGDGYEDVAASQTEALIGATGALGDYLAGLLVIPESTSPGAITLYDSSDGSPADENVRVIFEGGASSVSNLVPFFIPIGAKSVKGGWKVTTGAAVHVLAIGSFT